MFIVIAIIAFGVLILVHELGHFLMARLFDVKVNEFAMGMGPKLLRRQRGETLYSLRMLPFGGFCAMEGEDSNSEDPRAFTSKPWWQQAIILVAGALANFVLGFIAVYILRLTQIGLHPLDVLVQSGKDCALFVGLIFQSLKMLLSGEAGITDLSGPVGIVAVVTDVAKQSATAAMAAQNVTFFFAFIAVNLGVMNLLPIPALDGGRVLILLITTLIERIVGRRVSRRAESYIHGGAFILLIALMLFTLFNDIWKIVK